VLNKAVDVCFYQRISDFIFGGSWFCIEHVFSDSCVEQDWLLAHVANHLSQRFQIYVFDVHSVYEDFAL